MFGARRLREPVILAGSVATIGFALSSESLYFTLALNVNLSESFCVVLREKATRFSFEVSATSLPSI